MPPALAKAHDTLAGAVDRCYKPQGFQRDLDQVDRPLQALRTTRRIVGRSGKAK